MPTRSHPRFDFLAVDCGLSATGINNACALHEQHVGHPATTLVIDPRDIMLAYELLTGQWGKIPRLVIVPVPGWAGWAVCSPSFVVASCP